MTSGGHPPNSTLRFAVLDAPSILGLRPTGVEDLPKALRAAGLLDGLRAEDAGQVPTLPYSSERDPTTKILNSDALRAYSLRLAEAVAGVLARSRFPVVLGGDCSILLGCVLALRRVGRYGLFFIDGHTDFYQPEASLTGEAADMDLALVSGRGPAVLADMDGLRPLVRDEDIVVFGYRDAEEAARYGSQDIRDTGMHALDLAQVRAVGSATAASQAVAPLLRDELAGFWIHLDADVLDDAAMPAVDYRMPGGLSFAELTGVLKLLIASGRAVGLTVTIFNPSLDADGTIVRPFVSSIVAALS